MKNRKENVKEPPNLYKQWYEFLKLSDRNTWTEQVERDFKDVFEMNFKDWFERIGSGLFSQHGPTYRSKPVRYLLAGETTDHINLHTHFVLVIDRTQNLPLLEKKVKRYLEYETATDKEAYINAQGAAKRSRGVPKFKQLPSAYKLEARPDARALQQILQLLEVKRDNQNDVQWELGAKVKEKYDWLLPLMNLKNGVEPTDEQKELLQSSVSRLLARANKILRGVANGKFPVTK